MGFGLTYSAVFGSPVEFSLLELIFEPGRRMNQVKLLVKTLKMESKKSTNTQTILSLKVFYDVNFLIKTHCFCQQRI